MRWWRQTIPWGDIVVEVGPRGVSSISLPRSTVDERADAPRRDLRISGQLDEYFAGRRREFDVALDLPESLTELQRRVLLTLRDEVGYGETVTYGELAEMAGRPSAARAVGATMARNPVPFLIPCHRVVAANGIGGYGGGYGDGVALKRALLDLEGGVIEPLGPPGRAGRPRRIAGRDRRAALRAREAESRSACASLVRPNC